MSVFYRLHQDQSTGTKRSGKWYARAVPTACIGTRQLAEIIQRNCTVKKSDVMAVLEELVEVMKDQMQDSKRVKLDGFGSQQVEAVPAGLPRRGVASELGREGRARTLKSAPFGATLF